jgi:ankyrin repeat protein
MTPNILINNFKKIKKFVVLVGFYLFSSMSIAGSYEDFFIALQNDQVKVVSSLLSRGFDPNTVNLKAEPALLNALNVGALTSAEVLVRHPKINVNVRNAHGETALMLACLKGHVALAKLLISKQADINQPGWTPLHYAATGGHVELIQILLEESAYIDAESPNGTTPLMMAARYGSAKATQLLIDEGADLQVKNQLGLTPLDFAKQGNRTDALEIISKSLNQVITDKKSQ